jgi:hypothetical protein
VWYAYCKVINFVRKGASLEAAVHLMCIYALLYTVDILFLILMIGFTSTNETVMKWPCAIEIKGQGDMSNNLGESNLYLIKASVALVANVMLNNNHTYSEMNNHIISI